jgi:hypothetical protein
MAFPKTKQNTKQNTDLPPGTSICVFDETGLYSPAKENIKFK